jgi:cell division FtsZ-interacting protein ZapD
MLRAMQTAQSAERYLIVVRGAVSGRLLQTIEGVQASGQETVLTAEVVDQSQLHGILERLRDLGIDLISIQAVGGRRSGA